MNGQIFSLNRFAQTSPIRKTELHYQLNQYNQNRRITDLLLAIAVISGLMVPFLRDLGSSYSLATDWEVNRFAFSTSNGRFASLFDLIQQISFSILLLRAISKSRKANWLVISCSVFKITVFVIFAAGTALLALSFIYPEVLDSFLNRIGEDTRSNQYEIFYSQVEPASLIFGNGISAGYRYGTNSNYLFFDNQIIYLMFHFGVLAVVPLLYVLLRCLFGSSKNSQCKFVALFYLMAILGLSTYYSYIINVGVVLLFSSFGFALNNIEPERSNRMRNADGEK